MATPTRNLILENIAEVLAGITKVSGYKSTITGVDRFIRNWDDIGQSELPRLCFKPGRTRYQHQPGQMVRAVMPVQIVGHALARDGDEASDTLSDLEDDVWAALNADPYRGTNDEEEPNAISTTITEGETTEGDPDNNGIGTFELVAEVVYFRTTEAT